MAKNRTNAKRRKKGSAIPKETLSTHMQEHLRGLGMSTVEDYLDWCRQHGFACRLVKPWPQIEAESRLYHEHRAESAMRGMRSQRRPDRALKRLLRDNDSVAPTALEPVRALLRGENVSAKQRVFTERLLTHVEAVCSQMIFQRSGRGGAGDGIYLEALLRLAEYHKSVRREVESWKPTSHNSQRCFRSLVHHLYAEFAPPSFLECAWFEQSGHAVHYRRWYLHLASGKSVRGLDLPIPYSNKMYHYFLTAPNDYTVIQALRWGQVLGLGGDAHLASALRETKLCRSFDDERFWLTVIRFFVHHTMLDRNLVAPIIDYLHNQRFVEVECVNAEGHTQRMPPPQPNLTMRGRSPESLLRQVQEWHGQLSFSCNTKNHVWNRSQITPYRSIEGSRDNNAQRIWTIRELLTSVQLIQEGRVMRNCVASYAASCKRGQASIWTLEREDKNGKSKLLTIEVSLGRQIVQARGNMNRAPTEQARSVLEKWVAGAGLSMASWV